MPRRVRHDQIELARQILDIMDYESEALAVFGQQLGIAQNPCRALLCEIAGCLPTGRAQQIERLPIRVDHVGRAIEHDEADNFRAMRQRYGQPRLFGSYRPTILPGFRAASLNPATVPEPKNERVIDRHLAITRDGPFPGRCWIITDPATERPQHPGRAIDEFGQGADDPDREFLPNLGLGDQLDELQPLDAVI